MKYNWSKYIAPCSLFDPNTAYCEQVRLPLKHLFDPNTAYCEQILFSSSLSSRLHWHCLLLASTRDKYIFH